jgi:hypothetical protein
MPIVAAEHHGVIPDTFVFDRATFLRFSGEFSFVMYGD